MGFGPKEDSEREGFRESFTLVATCQGRKQQRQEGWLGEDRDRHPSSRCREGKSPDLWT